MQTSWPSHVLEKLSVSIGVGRLIATELSLQKIRWCCSLQKYSSITLMASKIKMLQKQLHWAFCLFTECSSFLHVHLFLKSVCPVLLLHGKYVSWMNPNLLHPGNLAANNDHTLFISTPTICSQYHALSCTWPKLVTQRRNIGELRNIW